MLTFGYDHEVAEAAATHGLDTSLVKAVVLVESSGRTSAYRYEPAFWLRYLAGKPEWAGTLPERVSASYGLMQVMYPTAKMHGYVGPPEGLFVPEVGLDLGCRHLKKLLDACGGNVEQALCQYNGGTTGNESPPYRNAPYARRVLRWVDAFHA